MEIRCCLEDIITEVLPMKIEEVFILYFGKYHLKAKEKYDCQLKIVQAGSSNIAYVKGIPSSVKDYLSVLTNFVKKFRIKIFFSERTKNYNKNQLQFLKEKLKSKNYFVIDRNKMSLIC